MCRRPFQRLPADLARVGHGGPQTCGAWMAPLAGLLALLGAGCLYGACRGPKEEALQAARCSRDRPCLKPNLCLGDVAGQGEGTCVRPCRSHGDCPETLRCTGRYVLSGVPGQFCRRPIVPEGGDCSGILPGCQKGLRCFRNRCHRQCSADAGCPDPRTRCLQVVDAPAPGALATVQYHVCLEALRKQGEPCDPAGPFCARTHVCHEGRCLRVCTTDSGCAAGQICDGSLYTGDEAKARAERGEPADLLYCRAAGGDNEPCNLRKDKSCARGLFCLGARCRKIQHAPIGAPCQEIRGLFCAPGAICHSGRCRRSCTTAKGCPMGSSAKPRCERVRVGTKTQGICL